MAAFPGAHLVNCSLEFEVIPLSTCESSIGISKVEVFLISHRADHKLSAPDTF